MRHHGGVNDALGRDRLAFAYLAPAFVQDAPRHWFDAKERLHDRIRIDRIWLAVQMKQVW